MRTWVRLAVVLIVVALIGTAFSGPKLNKFGVSDLAKVNFVAPIRVGATLLPAGDYEVRHTMAGEDHVMVFTQVGGKAEAKVKCTLVPTKEKAEQTQTIFQVNDAKERVLMRLIFKGDMAEHQF
jgi:phage terminase large subunit GpA-like protein